MLKKYEEIVTENDYTTKVCLLITQNGVGAYSDYNVMINSLTEFHGKGRFSIDSARSMLMLDGVPFGYFHAYLPVEQKSE